MNRNCPVCRNSDTKRVNTQYHPSALTEVHTCNTCNTEWEVYFTGPTTRVKVNGREEPVNTEKK